MPSRGRYLRRRLADLQEQVREQDVDIDRAEDMRRAEIAAAVMLAGAVARGVSSSMSSRDTSALAPEIAVSMRSHDERLRIEYGPEGLRRRLAALDVSTEDVERIAADLPRWSRYFSNTPRCGFLHGGELGAVR